MRSSPLSAPASPVSIDTTETEAKHRERTLMAIPSDRETLERAPEPSPALDLQSSLRRRLHSTAAAVVVTDSSSKAISTSVENLTIDSGEDSGVDTSSDADTRDRVVDGVDREEENKTVSVFNGRQYKDGSGRGEGQGTGGGVPAKFLYRASAPAHRKVKESPLSSDAIFKQSHAGLLNLCIVVLIAVNSRLIIENLMKYGLLIRAGYWFSSKSVRDWPLLMCCLTLPAFPLGAFMVEKLAQHKFISEPVVITLHVIITTAEILYPVIVILRCDSAVLSGITLMLFASVVWLKLVSYAHTNYDMRTLSKSLDKEDLYSNCPEIGNLKGVSFKSLVYFMVAPTLCYQPPQICQLLGIKYPRPKFPTGGTHPGFPKVDLAGACRIAPNAPGALIVCRLSTVPTELRYRPISYSDRHQAELLSGFFDGRTSPDDRSLLAPDLVRAPTRAELLLLTFIAGESSPDSYGSRPTSAELLRERADSIGLLREPDAFSELLPQVYSTRAPMRAELLLLTFIAGESSPDSYGSRPFPNLYYRIPNSYGRQTSPELSQGADESELPPRAGGASPQAWTARSELQLRVVYLE